MTRRKLTPKQRVQKKHPGAFAQRYRFHEPYERWFVYRVRPMGVLGYGHTPVGAWRNAAEGL